MSGSDEAVWEAYYEAMPRKEGRSARCAMELPDGLTGKRVLDLMCRRGKGVFKTASLVGPQGFVLGVDPSATFVAEARASLAKVAKRGDDDKRIERITFMRGCFEDLRAAGIEDSSFDLVFVNSALNLAWNLDASLREIVRVLVGGGALCHAGVFAENPTLPQPSDVRRFAAQGNVFGAARTQAAFERAILDAGFVSCEFSQVERVVPVGIDADEALAGATFVSAVVLAMSH